ncbi:MAG: hypothetical protein JHC38_04930 [Thiotrichales bacterium]|jgi:hypothetical protein|nr:hypothetical protein [Thiotrichales bacterium]
MCSFAAWRFGRVLGACWYLERWGAMLVLFIWLYYVLYTRDILAFAQQGNLHLVDVLLGLPLVVAVGLVGAVIWIGLVRTLCCVMNKVEEPHYEAD